MPRFMVWNTVVPFSAMAVPICTADAPARMNSTASRQFVTPPQPIMGTFSRS